MSRIESYQCDRCGVEQSAHQLGSSMKLGPNSYDLCKECAKKAKEWLDVPGCDLKAKRLRDGSST